MIALHKPQVAIAEMGSHRYATTRMIALYNLQVVIAEMGSHR